MIIRVVLSVLRSGPKKYFAPLSFNALSIPILMIVCTISFHFFCPLNQFKPSSNIFTDCPRRYFFCGSVIFFLSCVCYAFVRVCLYVPCGHLLEKG